MPGIFLNRLSRPKAGESPSEQLAAGRALLLGEMRPVLLPDGKEGVDYIYLEDIESRLSAHKEGRILDRAMQLMRQGRCAFVAVTEVARITGDLGAAAEILQLCRDHRIPIYTRERLKLPFEPWRPESEQDLFIAIMVSGLEVIGYRARVARAFAAAYTMDPDTAEKRQETFQGLGRFMNGRVPIGYKWNKATKEVEKDDVIPFPDYIPPGATRPAAKTWYEIIERVLQLSFTHGSVTLLRQLHRETGASLFLHTLSYVQHNPFYAGRPTSRLERRAGKLVKREKQVATVGKYPAMLTWEQFEQLGDIISERLSRGDKTYSSSWASGLVRCVCGQPFIGHCKTYYSCRGVMRENQVNVERRRQERFPGQKRVDLHKPLEDWERTPTCGFYAKSAIHAHIETALRDLLARPDILERLALWEARQAQDTRDNSVLRAEAAEVEKALEKLERRRATVIDMGVDEQITRQEVSQRLTNLSQEKIGLSARLETLRENMTRPPIAPERLEALRALVGQDFAALWNDAELMSNGERAQIARALIDHIPISGNFQSKKLGSVVFIKGLE